MTSGNSSKFVQSVVHKIRRYEYESRVSHLLSKYVGVVFSFLFVPVYCHEGRCIKIAEDIGRH